MGRRPAPGTQAGEEMRRCRVSGPHVPLHSAHLMDEAAGDMGAPKDGEVIALGVGGGDITPDLLEYVVEQEEAPRSRISRSRRRDRGHF